jgi:23S rRNA (pseudouridine1915-N3)-methyltransferase
MKTVLLSIETSKQEWFTEFTELYESKISRIVSFEIKKLKSRGLARDAQDRKIKEETELLLKNIDDGDFVVLCDEKGVGLNSQAFAKKMISMMESGKRRLVFVIGGAYGTGDELKKRANWNWCLAPMTLSHFIAQAVAVEQIYRALTIWKGVPYHNE